MRVRPRQQLLEIWESVARSSWSDDGWGWGGSHGPNSISDAEQLLCLLLPATKVEAFELDRPDQFQELLLILGPVPPGRTQEKYVQMAGRRQDRKSSAASCDRRE